MLLRTLDYVSGCLWWQALLSLMESGVYMCCHSRGGTKSSTIFDFHLSYTLNIVYFDTPRYGLVRVRSFAGLQRNSYTRYGGRTAEPLRSMSLYRPRRYSSRIGKSRDLGLIIGIWMWLLRQFPYDCFRMCQRKQNLYGRVLQNT